MARRSDLLPGTDVTTRRANSPLYKSYTVGYKGDMNENKLNSFQHYKNPNNITKPTAVSQPTNKTKKPTAKLVGYSKGNDVAGKTIMKDNGNGVKAYTNIAPKSVSDAIKKANNTKKTVNKNTNNYSTHNRRTGSHKTMLNNLKK